LVGLTAWSLGTLTSVTRPESLIKQQARAILRLLASIQPSTPHPSRSYVVPDADPVDHRGIQELERDLIFSNQNKDRDLSLMHNDFTTSNCIVNNDKLVGLEDSWGGSSRVAADRGLGHVERGYRWGSAKAERGHRWSPRKKVGGTTLLPIQNAHR
jgi:hypothetical protein